MAYDGIDHRVVPRKGDVDRNSRSGVNGPYTSVVPRKGDVDRNYCYCCCRARALRSSPARGTWIEMVWPTLPSLMPRVVPRKGDVDRNIREFVLGKKRIVVPRKGDVDRNGKPH